MKQSRTKKEILQKEPQYQGYFSIFRGLELCIQDEEIWSEILNIETHWKMLSLVGRKEKKISLINLPNAG